MERKWLILSAVSVGTFMATLDGSIVNISLPDMQQAFGISIATVEWVIVAYLLTVGAVLLPFGRLGEVLSFRRVYLAGFAVFTTASILCGAAPSAEVLVLFRVAQGVGAGGPLGGPAGAVAFGRVYGWAGGARPPASEAPPAARARELDARMRRLFGRSLRLRSVAAGSCNGCEAELVALGNVVFDLARFGVQFVASPRHADGIVLTGAVSRNMESALRATCEATPSPKLVIAVGACAVNGGPFRGSPEVLNGAPPDVPVDLWIPGCPPHPLTLLDGLLGLLGRLERKER